MIKMTLKIHQHKRLRITARPWIRKKKQPVPARATAYHTSQQPASHPIRGL